MIIINWNCRGLGNPRVVLALGELVRSRQPDILSLWETLVHADKIEVKDTISNNLDHHRRTQTTFNGENTVNYIPLESMDLVLR